MHDTDHHTFSRRVYWHRAQVGKATDNKLLSAAAFNYIVRLGFVETFASRWHGTSSTRGHCWRDAYAADLLSNAHQSVSGAPGNSGNEHKKSSVQLVAQSSGVKTMEIKNFVSIDASAAYDHNSHPHRGAILSIVTIDNIDSFIKTIGNVHIF